MKEKILEISEKFNETYNKKFWATTHISGDQNTFERNKPAAFIRKTIEIANLLKLKTVVEIGATRYAITKDCIGYFNNETNPIVSPPCCADGHGGIMFALNGFDVDSVDIDVNCITQAIWSFENIKEPFPDNLSLEIPKDGIEYLRNYNKTKTIDILFLDGWNVGEILYAENHLEAFKVAQKSLSKIHLILIDDTDFNTPDGGKDRLLTPHLLNLGYTQLFNGRQTLYINTLNF